MTQEVAFMGYGTYSRPEREPENHTRIGPGSAGRQNVKKER